MPCGQETPKAPALARADQSDAVVTSLSPVPPASTIQALAQEEPKQPRLSPKEATQRIRMAGTTTARLRQSHHKSRKARSPVAHRHSPAAHACSRHPPSPPRPSQKSLPHSAHSTLSRQETKWRQGTGSQNNCYLHNETGQHQIPAALVTAARLRDEAAQSPPARSCRSCGRIAWSCSGIRGRRFVRRFPGVQSSR